MDIKKVNLKDDIVDFFGCTLEKLIEPFTEICKGSDENAWKRCLFKGIESLEETHKIYKDTNYYIIQSRHIGYTWFDAIMNTGLNNILFHLYKIIPGYENKKIKILDYGCGRGVYGLWFALNGFDVTLADIPNKHFRFLEYLSDKYKLNIKFYNIPCSNYFDFPEKYDYIINSEVMEHCYEPIEAMKSLRNAMHENSVMYLSTFFDDCRGNDPSHLFRNTDRYNSVPVWLNEINKLDMEFIATDQNGVVKGLVKKDSPILELYLKDLDNFKSKDWSNEQNKGDVYHLRKQILLVFQCK